MLVLLSVILQDDGVCIPSDSLDDKIYSSVLHSPGVVCWPVPHQTQNLYILCRIAYQEFPELKALAECPM